MKKFIIVDTFNGEGYSESKAHTVELKDLDAAKIHAYNYLVESLGGLKTMVTAYTCGTLSITISDERISFDDETDQGAVHFEELPVGIVSVTINPDVNEYSLHDAESDAEVVEYIKSESEDFEQLEDCHHLDDEVVIYQKL